MKSLRHPAGTGKWKCLFVSGCECESPIYTVMVFVSSCHIGANVGDYFEKSWWFSGTGELHL